MQHVSHVAMRNLESIFFATPPTTLWKSNDMQDVQAYTTKCNGRIHCRTTKKCFWGSTVAVHYTTRVALSGNDDDNDGSGEKNLGNSKIHFLQFDSPWFYSFHDLASPQSIVLDSFFAEFKVRRQIHERPGYMLIRLRLHRRKGVEP